MLRNIFFFIKTALIFSLFISHLYAQELPITPLKKPIFDKKKTAQKLLQEIIKPKSKPSKKKEEIKVKIEEKKDKKITFLIPKSKPLVVKKSSLIIKTTSQYYSQKDFVIAKKSIQAIEKQQWTSALSLSKKAKDKSIHKFIQWQYLLTTGNQASFYDYMTFINHNANYPRINRIKYLAEHKLSTDRISPKKNSRLVCF